VGIPVLRFHWKWGEHETNQAAHAVKTFLEVIDRLGGKPEHGSRPTAERRFPRAVR